MKYRTDDYKYGPSQGPCEGGERQMKSCHSVFISCCVSSLTSLYMVTFPNIVVRNTFSFHILTKLLIFIRRKQGLFKFLPERTIREISNCL